MLFSLLYIFIPEKFLSKRKKYISSKYHKLCSKKKKTVKRLPKKKKNTVTNRKGLLIYTSADFYVIIIKSFKRLRNGVVFHNRRYGEFTRLQKQKNKIEGS